MSVVERIHEAASEGQSGNPIGGSGWLGKGDADTLSAPSCD